MEPSCIDLYVFAGQSNVLGWGVGPLEMQRVLSRLRVLVLRTRWQRAARRQRDAQAVLSDLATQCRAHAAPMAPAGLQFSAFAMAGRRRNATGGGRNCAAAVDALELRRSQMEVAAHVDGAEWVDTDGATYRNIHLAAQGHFELGVAVAERLSK